MKKGIQLLFLFITISFTGCYNDEYEEIEFLPDLTNRLKAGGETTVFNRTSFSYSFPASNLDDDEDYKHGEGDKIFDFRYVTSPNPINPGLGPIFNNNSCVGCHPNDGRAIFPKNINARSGFFLRTSLGVDADFRNIPVPGFGEQLQNQALIFYGFQPEVSFAVTYTDIEEVLADGTKVILKKPHYSVTNSYIPFPANALLSPRIGTPVFGLGLLENIPDQDLIAAEDPSDRDGDGISGRVNWVYDAVSQTKKIGRFGWKANTATLMEQCAAAFVNDMGVTNPLFPKETGDGQTNGNDGNDDDPEIDQQTLDMVTFYTQSLAVPAARNLDKTSVRKGAKIFEEIGCAKCHTPKQRTGNSAINALKNQTFYPYTDMLLHDMGEDLADNRPDFMATGTEWKTRPLWGIGLQDLVNGHTEFLHDGRAKNITEAILWHGGEAKNAKENFKKLSKKDREDLLEFLNSI